MPVYTQALFFITRDQKANDDVIIRLLTGKNGGKNI